MKRKQILIIALSLAVVAAGVVFLISRGANGDIDPVQPAPPAAICRWL